jgi:predicted enzyme involved in methoxymalonyl-ACP biosynthesis
VDIDISKKEAGIELFLLSCRILGNGIENEYLKIILNILFQKGIRVIFATYVPTLKNMQTENFFDGFGFKVVESENGVKKYKLLLRALFEIDKKFKYHIN